MPPRRGRRGSRFASLEGLTVPDTPRVPEAPRVPEDASSTRVRSPAPPPTPPPAVTAEIPPPPLDALRQWH